jgi:protein phosphatase slingshot
MEDSLKKNDDKEEQERDNIYLNEMKNELKKAALDFRTGKTDGKEDTKVDKMLKLLNMIKLSSTIKILKDDNAPIEIIPHLYLGSIGSASNLKQLQNCKITHILCCASGIKNFFPNNFKYLNLDILDSEKVNIKQYFEQTNQFIDEAIKNNGSVLVHCHAGISRSSTILMAYIMKSQKMSVDKVLDLLKSKREKVNPNSGFIGQLREYEKDLGII